jgi:phosphoribosylformylglycinamidine (FGAM) synthase-like amidotransferase family enzyme
MRLGLHGLGGPDPAFAPWPSLIATLGGGAELVERGTRCDALLVCGVLEAPEGETVAAFARSGGAVLGVGHGFRSLCGLGLLPGSVRALAEEDDGPADAHVRVEGRATPFTSAIPAGRVMSLTGATAVGFRYDIGAPQALEARGQVIFRYCDAAGGPLTRKRSPADARAADASQLRLSSVPLIAPRESARAIAGVCSEIGNVVGVLAAAAALEGIGAQLLGSLRMHLRGKR